MDKKTQQLLKMAESDDESSVSFAERTFEDQPATDAAFAFYKSKILEMDEWNNFSVWTSFTLFDESGKEMRDKNIRENIFCRLSLKGSGKFDWVKVVGIFETASEIVITVKPTFDPTDKDSDRAETSHFFSAASSNNFCLLKDDKSVGFYIIGLQEEQNTSETKSTLETIRNVVTANAGSYLGIQKGEWTNFCKNFLDSY